MAKFSEKKIGNALRHVAHTLPTVKIMDESLRIRPFNNDLDAFQTAMALAEQVTPLGIGLGQVGDFGSNLKMVATLSCLAGMMLVDGNGDAYFKDIDDYKAWYMYTQGDGDLERKKESKEAYERIIKESGIEEWVASKVAESKKPTEIQPISENGLALGNSEPSQDGE